MLFSTSISIDKVILTMVFLNIARDTVCSMGKTMLGLILTETEEGVRDLNSV